MSMVDLPVSNGALFAQVMAKSCVGRIELPRNQIGKSIGRVRFPAKQ